MLLDGLFALVLVYILVQSVHWFFLHVNFLDKLLNEIFCDLKLAINSKHIIKNKFLPIFTLKLKNNLNFSILETHYQIFKNLSNLNIVFITNAKNVSEFIFLLKSYKIFK